MDSDVHFFMVCRWHLGYCKDSVTPTYRGFNSFYGFYGGQENYYTYKVGEYKNKFHLKIEVFVEVFFLVCGVGVLSFSKFKEGAK